jgi:hypothetical protein
VFFPFLLINLIGQARQFRPLLVEDSLVSRNQIGIGIKSSNPIIRISNAVVTKNGTGLSAGIRQILSFSNNKISGNTFENMPTGVINQQ